MISITYALKRSVLALTVACWYTVRTRQTATLVVLKNQGIDLELASGKVVFVPWQDVLGIVFTPKVGDFGAKSLAVRAMPLRLLSLKEENLKSFLAEAEKRNFRPQYAASSAAADFVFIMAVMVGLIGAHMPMRGAWLLTLSGGLVIVGIGTAIWLKTSCLGRELTT